MEIGSLEQEQYRIWECLFGAGWGRNCPQEKDTAKDDQVWYLEPLENGTGVIRTSQEYTAGMRQTARVVDAKGMETSYQYDDQNRLFKGAYGVMIEVVSRILRKLNSTSKKSCG